MSEISGETNLRYGKMRLPMNRPFSYMAESTHLRKNRGKVRSPDDDPNP